MVIGEDAPFHDGPVPEEEHEAEFDPSRAQVIEELFFPLGIEVLSRLVFEHDDGLDKRICLEDADGLRPEIDDDFDFPLEPKSCVLQCDRHGVGVNEFKMSWPKFRVHLVKHSNDLISERAVKQTIGQVALPCHAVFCRANAVAGNCSSRSSKKCRE
jgi:hypothetical protein